MSDCSGPAALGSPIAFDSAAPSSSDAAVEASSTVEASGTEAGSPADTGAPDALPVVHCRSQLMALIRKHQVVIVAGETGSGKTTQLPQFLAAENLVSPTQRLAVTQPRRLAAVAVADRVALEMHAPIGSVVGYTVRFDDKTSPETAIRFMTDGLLLREFLANPRLEGYAAVMIDEAHERTLHTDIVLALVRDVVRQRPDFKVLVSSATMNSAKFAAYFDNAPVYSVPGRRFPVQMFYTSSAHPDYIQAAVTTVLQIHVAQPLDGHILVFLTGQDDIESMEDKLGALSVELGSAVPELLVVPVFANMQPEQQARIFAATPPNCRKVILATNIAETSLTIPGTAYVVDSGLVKEQEYNSRSGLDSLTVRHCSKASADQRAGRAGRTGPGKCFRLYTRSVFERDMPDETRPEVLRSNLASVCLLLLTLGVANVTKFGFLDKPTNEAVAAALTELYALGAVNQACLLTKRGRILEEFPTNPQMARALISSVEYECVDAVTTIVAMLGEMGSVYVRPKGRKAEASAAHAQLRASRGDHFTLLNIYSLWKSAKYNPRWCRENFIQQRALRRARDVKQQLQNMCVKVAKRAGLKPKGEQPNGVEMSLISGFFTRCARLNTMSQHYIPVVGHNQAVYIHPGSVLWGADPPLALVMYHELVLTSKEYMRGCMEVDPAVLKKVVPHFYYQHLEKRENVRGG